MVVESFWADLPLVHLPTAAFSAHSVLRREVFRDEAMALAVVTEER